MAVLAMTVAWVHKIGEWRAEIKPIQWKRFKGGQLRPQTNYFRYKIDFICESLVRVATDSKQLRDCIDPIQPENLLLGGLT